MILLNHKNKSRRFLTFFSSFFMLAACGVREDETGDVRPNDKEKIKEEIMTELRKELKKDLDGFGEALLEESERRSREIFSELTAKQANDEIVVAKEPKVREIAETEDVGHSNAREEKSKPVRERKRVGPSQSVGRDERGLKILSHVLAEGVNKRLPISPGDEFPLSINSIFCYIEVASVYEQERSLTLRWIHASGITQSYTLPIGESPAWRTWSKLNLTTAMVGEWSCEIYNEDGVLLSYAPFGIVGE